MAHYLDYVLKHIWRPSLEKQMLIVFCATSRYYSHTKCQKFGPLESSGDLRELALAAVQVVPFLVLSFYYWQYFFFVPWLRLGCSGFMLVWSNFGHFWEDKVKSRRSNLYTKNVFFVVYFCLFVFLSCKRYLTKNPVHCQCPYYSIDEIVVHTKSNISKTVAEAKVKSWKVSVQVWLVQCINNDIRGICKRGQLRIPTNMRITNKILFPRHQLWIRILTKGGEQWELNVIRRN